jgi:O-antigen/teichoic acid export membrane protein
MAPKDPSLARRILRETTRFAGIQVIGALLLAASNLVLARLLDPHAFGAYAIGTFFLGLGGLLGDGGLGAALLRNRGEVTEGAYRTTVTFLLGLGAALALGFYAAAPSIAVHWQLAPGEATVLRAMAVLFLVGPLRSVPYIRLERELRFSRIAGIELAATFTRQLVTVALAWRLGGMRALAGGQLAGALVQLALAWRAARGWPGLGVDPKVLRATLGEGVPVQALAIAAFFKDNLSAALLGSLMGPSAVGRFDFGLKYAALPVVAVNALSRVQLPVYARFDAKDPQLHQAFVGATRTALLLGLPLLVALSVGAPAIVPWLYAPRWVGSIPVVHGILVNMAFGLLAGPLFTLLQGQGEGRLALKVFAGWTLATWALVLVVWHHQLSAVAWAYSAVTAPVVLGLVHWAGRHLGRPLWGAYAGPFAAGLAAWSLVLLSSPGPLARAGLAVLAYVAVLAAIEGRRALHDLRAWVTALR